VTTIQAVDAVAGFGYGVIGADVHVFADGVPLYVLRNRDAAPRPDSAWLREMPSRMLNARFAVVGFTGRSDDVADLDTWRRDGPRLGACWLHGPGGAGKSRLAGRVAERAAADGWKVVTAAHGPGTVLPPPGSQDLRLDGAAGVLLIVDYADRWPAGHLAWLLRNTVLHQLGKPSRVLLLARTPDVPATVRDAVDRVILHALSPLPVEAGGRDRMFVAARDGFATHYEIDPATVESPASLDAPDMGLVLAVHMAALVAVDSRVTGGSPPSDVAGLTVYLLDRENQHWAVRAVATSPRVMNQTVFTAALTGAVDRRGGVALLGRAAVPGDPEQVLTDHARLYPAAGRAGEVLEPLLPDRLAEDFLALTMPGHAADYPARSWAAATTTAVLRPAPSRPVLFLAAATERWAHVGTTYLFPLLREQPHLAVAAGSPALSALAALDDVPVPVLEAIEPLLPAGRHADLDVGAAAIAVALTRHRLARTRDRAERAGLYHALSWRLANAGRYAQALAASRRAVALRRRLARDHAAHRPDLAASLNNLANQLSAIGARDQAVRAGRQAIRILRRLGGRYLPELASALSNFGVLLAARGRRAEALRAAEEAVSIRRRRAGREPAALAAALNNLAGRRAALGRRADALAPGRESVALRRRLVEADRAAHLSDLASSLNNVAVWMAGLDRREEACVAAEEAATLYRELSRLNPGAYRTNLAICLNNLGVLLTNLGRRREALAPSEEAVEIHRLLARNNPDRHLADLAAPLNNLSILLAEQGRIDDALPLAREAVEIYRSLTRVDRDAHTPDLAMALTTLAARLSEAGRPDEALPLCTEAVGIYRDLAAAERDAWLPDLASAVHNLGVLLSEVGRSDQALAPSGEAVRLRRELGRPPDLAQSLSSLAAVLSENARPAAAEEAAEEATGIYRDLAVAHPAIYRADLALALSNLGVMRWEAGRRERGVATTRQSAEEYRALDTDPADLAGALNNLGLMLSGLDEHAEALAVSREAVDIYRTLDGPADLAMALETYASACLRSERELAPGRSAAEEAVRLYEGLADRLPEAFGRSLESARRTRDALTGRG
jgi:tetratricopeptide (TPR) repeat protein